MPAESITEAQRQLQICNACRYCEGFCAVFPSIHRLRDFSAGDVTQLANLCHNCRGCHYACQYSEPHEFRINVPRALADVRVESWEKFAKPASFGRYFQRYGLAIAGLSVICVTLVFLLMTLLPATDAPGFYRYLSHTVMITLFIPAFVFPLAAIGFGLRDYWRTVKGKPVSLSHLRSAFGAAARLRNLAGGQGQGDEPDQGCNYEASDRFSHKRRYAHQCAMWGFLLCFASTTSATVMHYLLALPAPYPFWSLPKLLGLSGGVLLVAGCGVLAWLKTRADTALGPRWYGGEMAFVVLLGFTGLSGLVLYAFTNTEAVPMLLAVHLGAVLSLFLLLPYSRMVHGAYRLAALVRDAQQRQET
ncbi:MAG: tricarballylate utilization 4Fe-4S protein TcuB [Gammaproteobacteria bacterium]|nr:tricarballylate utilization 4Fe-4S protein TcuB [Gammaproteobacteria bacterium]